MSLLTGLFRALLRTPAGDRAAAALASARRALAAGDAEQAVRLLEAHLQRAPDDVDALHLLALTEVRMGRVREALPLLERTVVAAPTLADAWVDLGTARLHIGDARGAAAAYERAMDVAGERPDAFANLAGALLAMHDAVAAERAARRALELQPGNVTAQHNLGNALLAQGRLDEAGVALEAAARSAPDDPRIACDMAWLQQERGDRDGAIRRYREVLERAPTLLPALNNIEIALQAAGEFEEARGFLARATAIEPSTARRIKLAMSIPAIPDSHAQIPQIRAKLDADLDELLASELALADPLAQVGRTGFYLAYHGHNDLALQRKIAQVYTRACPALASVAPHCGVDNPRPRGRRIRVGFVSTFLHQHTIGNLMTGLIEGLDRERIEVVAGLFPQPDDELSRRVRAAAASVVELPLNLEAAREALAAAGLDVLFYPDIGMHPATYVLAFARLAPVQCLTWGHPVTSGIPALDYFHSAVELEPADGDGHYSERLLRMPALNFWYERAAIPQPLVSREALGLASDWHLYTCPQSLFKLHPDNDAVFGAILRGDPRARIVLLATHSPVFMRTLKERYRRAFPEAADRVLFIRRLNGAEYLSLAAHSDVVLDPLHFAGGRSSAEIFAMNGPIVTLRGRCMRSWPTAAMYRHMGLEDAIARDADDYVRIALALGTDADFRADFCARLAARSGVLYQNMASVRQLQTFFEQVVEGERP